ncbi:MAG: PilZ domain-containing protein [Nitrospirota bacterium]|nr:PilZ domain-containing protein [Nitrospirota bacterium]
MKSTRESIRYRVTKKRECSFCVITFKDLSWTDHKTTVVNISRHGVGVEADDKLEPGFVWFLDRMGGFRGGVLMWARNDNRKYHAGIRFIELSRYEEQFIQEQVALIRANKPLTNPEAVLATIMRALTGTSSVPSGPKRSSAKKADGDDPLGDIQDMVAKM